MACEKKQKDRHSVNEEDGISDTVKDALVCYCGKNVTPSMLKCLNCEKLFHGKCLKGGRPSNFKGDVFFEFTCVNCSDTGKETFKRKAMNWLQVVYLALYNLICRGSGRKGYFRWKDDLCQFIEQNWNAFHADKKKTSSWCSTVAGTLSTHCPKIFKSGQKEFKEGGWWTLHEVLPPSEKLEVMTHGANSKRKRKGCGSRTVTGGWAKGGKKHRVENTADVNGNQGSEHEKGKDEMTLNNSTEDIKSPAVEADLAEQINTFLGSNGDISDLDIGDLGAMDEIFDTLDPNKCDDSLISSFTMDDNKDETGTKLDHPCISNTDESGVIVLDPNELNDSQPSASTIENNHDDASSESEVNNSHSKRLRRMSLIEEHDMLEKLNRLDSVDPRARRLRRKMLLNNQKRHFGLTVFDLDAIVKNSLNSVSHYIAHKEECKLVLKRLSDENIQASSIEEIKSSGTANFKQDRILDRFMMQPVSQKPEKQVSFLGRLVGCHPSALNRLVTSPYTSRVLKPFIRRDFEAAPTKLKILKEICTCFQRKLPDDVLRNHPPCKFGSIDYCYMQPHHIPGVNALCREFFWPGIDLSECLQYPDFTCVVLYKKLIIGCAFMVPDVKWNEAYISFVVVHPDWRKAGIGSFMIYHLIQTCLGKDVTLHVSANNSAMLLYQKFGFKPERFVIGFYDRYYPPDGEHSKHAFFLRLQR